MFVNEPNYCNCIYFKIQYFVIHVLLFLLLFVCIFGSYKWDIYIIYESSVIEVVKIYYILKSRPNVTYVCNQIINKWYFSKEDLWMERICSIMYDILIYILQAYTYKHFIARTLGLIILPALVYICFFFIHLKVLNKRYVLYP